MKELKFLLNKTVKCSLTVFVLEGMWKTTVNSKLIDKDIKFKWIAVISLWSRCFECENFVRAMSDCSWLRRANGKCTFTLKVFYQLQGLSMYTVTKSVFENQQACLRCEDH